MQVGKHIVPRYLYHITTTDCYNAIKRTGYIKPHLPNNHYKEAAIFTFDLKNALLRWHQTPMGETSLLSHLLQQGRGDNIVILRIPTENLDVNKLRIRGQNWYFNPGNKLPKTQINKLREYAKSIEDKGIDIIERFSMINKFRKELIAKIFPKMKNHWFEGSPATQAPLFEKCKEPIEYIYSDKIPANEVECLGQADRSKYYENFSGFIKKTNVKPLLLELFEKCKEKIAIEKYL